MENCAREIVLYKTKLEYIIFIVKSGSVRTFCCFYTFQMTEKKNTISNQQTKK